jgi:hypothetical protein
MANVIQLSRFRGVSRRDLPLNIPAGDSDLRAVAIMLWVGSIIRTILSLIHHEAFGVEASLAVCCVIFLPLFISRARHVHDTARQ